MGSCEGRPGCQGEAEWGIDSSTAMLTPWAPLHLDLCDSCHADMLRWPTRPEPLGCIGIGGRFRETVTDTDLGRGGRDVPAQGLRRAAWDAALGYVSGFRKRDIAYWVLTRSLSSRVRDLVRKVEGH